ncbi:uncharacterized protein LOC128921785, partial [Zeugodacus cucurbitae]|uniref:uncharacterized protein LOC128921785 n=1 Tax=Zeugodacus cucurbitae TaxID=28588 RepID=UPI0023D8F2FF
FTTNSFQTCIFFILASISLTKADSQNFYYTAGQRKSVKLVYGGYQYVKFMENSKGIKWICSTRSTTKCRARVRTTKNSQLEVLHAKHNHSFIQKKYPRKIDEDSKLDIEHIFLPKASPK